MSWQFQSNTNPKSVSKLKALRAPKSTFNSGFTLSPTEQHTNHWNCSSCNTFNQSQRNTNTCNNCGANDSDPNRTKANAFYQFGIISSPKTALLPNNTPFFIYPLRKPKIDYYTKPSNNGITIRFIIHLTNTNQTSNYIVSQIRFAIKNTSNNKYKGLKKVISNPTKRGTFDTFLSKPYFGNYKLEIQALIKYKMSVKNGHKKYNKYSPVTQLNMTLERQMYYHESLLQNYIVSESEFMRHECAENDDEKYYEPKLCKLESNNDDYNLVYFQFLESSYITKDDIDHIFIYKIYNKIRSDGYKGKKNQILKSLGNISKLNEIALYHGTDIDIVVKILHQGFLRQFSSRAMYGQGVYFAKEARYSGQKSYAKPDDDGFQHILLCNVICGEWIHGDANMKVPPDKPNKQYLPFETTVDKEKDPRVIVTYQDDQALPRYLISFKKSKD